MGRYDAYANPQKETTVAPPPEATGVTGPGDAAQLVQHFINQQTWGVPAFLLDALGLGKGVDLGGGVKMEPSGRDAMHEKAGRILGGTNPAEEDFRTATQNAASFGTIPWASDKLTGTQRALDDVKMGAARSPGATTAGNVVGAGGTAAAASAALATIAPAIFGGASLLPMLANQGVVGAGMGVGQEGQRTLQEPGHEFDPLKGAVRGGIEGTIIGSLGKGSNRLLRPGEDLKSILPGGAEDIKLPKTANPSGVGEIPLTGPEALKAAGGRGPVIARPAQGFLERAQQRSPQVAQDVEGIITGRNPVIEASRGKLSQQEADAAEYAKRAVVPGGPEDPAQRGLVRNRPVTEPDLTALKPQVQQRSADALPGAPAGVAKDSLAMQKELYDTAKKQLPLVSDPAQRAALEAQIASFEQRLAGAAPRTMGAEEAAAKSKTFEDFMRNMKPEAMHPPTTQGFTLNPTGFSEKALLVDLAQKGYGLLTGQSPIRLAKTGEILADPAKLEKALAGHHGADAILEALKRYGVPRAGVHGVTEWSRHQLED